MIAASQLETAGAPAESIGRVFLLRQMPDPKCLVPNAANEAYRRAFYARWGRHSCIVCATSRNAQYLPFRQRLSIKVARGGRERYLMDNRSVAVDDDNFLILNDQRTYSSAIQTDREMESYSIFFRPGMAEEVLGALLTPADRVFERRDARAHGVEFSETLQPHDRVVTPVLDYIRHHVKAGFDDEAWYEEQLHFLLHRMLAHHRQLATHALRVPAFKRATRMEIYRRVALACDYIHSRYDREIDLGDLASAACLSKYHFLRLFTDIHRLTPYAYLQRKRARVASRLLTNTSLTTSEIAAQVGYTARSSLFRQVRRWTGLSPAHLRRGHRNGPVRGNTE